MSLFQKSILDKYLAEKLSVDQVRTAYQKFVDYFHNLEIQKNIRQAKEEQFQEGFLRELFVNVLGYTINPNQHYNLSTEFKNLKDTKKADGAILDRENVKAIIELKDTKTVNLKNIENQAFGYKNNQKNCRYVITSNFEKLRLYVDNAIDFEEWDLFNLSESDFKVLFLLLNKDHLLADLPADLKKDSLIEEENISKRFYQEYSTFRKELFQNLMLCNPEVEKLLLFKKTQKLLDRFLFLFFAKDKGLVPSNVVLNILESWKANKYNPLIPQQSLYEYFKFYFHYLNVGFKNEKLEIFAYNGGLFAPDEIIDNFKITDNILEKACQILSKYNYDSEVDVNILGHIFEHSLKEIEELEAQFFDDKIKQNQKVTKRKKDGIFYTPRYITKYIVENTLGVLCSQEKQRRDLKEEDYFFRKNIKANKATIQTLLDNLHNYKGWLLNLSIVDPACGSGAFLNQALTFLINEHKWLNELEAKLTGSSLVFDLENSILENNLFGVDINEESVEISKLSLWLRTAKPHRQLTSLNDNIKCGNSLVDDPNVAGEKAFNWQQAFPHIFAKGGFDVVIGNPPYVRSELIKENMAKYFNENYQTYHHSSDLFAYFYEKGLSILNKEGMFSFISNTFDKTSAGKTLREFIVKKFNIIKYIDFIGVNVFEGATTYPIITILSKNQHLNNTFHYIKVAKNSLNDISSNVEMEVKQGHLNPNGWSFTSSIQNTLLSKIKKYPTIRETYGKCYYGIKTALNKAFIIPNDFPKQEHLKPIYEGKEIQKWITPNPKQQLIFFKSKWTKEHYDITLEEDVLFSKVKMDFPKIFAILEPFVEQAEERQDKGDFWWELRDCAYYDLFEKPKIIFPNLQNSNKFCFDENGVYVSAPAVFLPTDDKILLGILNSKLIWLFLKSICVVRSGGYIEVKPQYFEQIPITTIGSKKKATFIEKVNIMLALNQKLLDLKTDFNEYLTVALKVSKLSKILQNPEKHSLEQLTAELKKQKVNANDFNIFNSIKVLHSKFFEIKNEIEITDQKINQMVYELYELTPEEIAVIENSS